MITPVLETDRLLFDYGTDAYITDVIVHPEYQGNGIGKLLIDDVLELSRFEGDVR